MLESLSTAALSATWSVFTLTYGQFRARVAVMLAQSHCSGCGGAGAGAVIVAGVVGRRAGCPAEYDTEVLSATGGGCNKRGYSSMGLS